MWVSWKLPERRFVFNKHRRLSAQAMHRLQQSPFQANTAITLISPRIEPGSSDPLTVIWFAKGRNLNGIFNVTTSRAEISLDPSLQQTQIVCVIENELGRAAHFFILDFHAAPRFLRSLDERMEVELGENVHLAIHVTANPVPIFQWWHGEEIIDEKRTKTAFVNNVIVHSLFLKEIKSSDLGNYSVVVQNTEKKLSTRTCLILKSRK